MQLATLIAFLAAAGVVAIRLNRPVAVLQKSLRAVAEGRLDEHVEVRTTDEFRTLADTINYMIDGLRERESLRRAFEQYLGQEIRSRSPGGLSTSRSGDVNRPITWLACDLGRVIGNGVDDDPDAAQAAVEKVLGSSSARPLQLAAASIESSRAALWPHSQQMMPPLAKNARCAQPLALPQN